MQSPGRERCSLQKSCSQHFFFFRRRGAKRGTAAGRADGKAEMGVGGEVLLFWQNPSFLLQISLREDCAARAPVREPEPLPGSRSKEPASPRSLDCVRDRSHRHGRVPGWPRAPPPAGLTPRPAGQCPNHIQGGNRSRIQAPSPRSHHVPGGQQSPHPHSGSLAPVPQTSCSRSHSAPT